MKNKHMIRTFAVLLAVMLCMTAFSTVAFASSEDEAPASEAQTEPTDSTDITGDDLSELISTLFSSMLGGTEKSGKTGTVTTNGGKLNVRTGAGLDNYAFTQLPNGTVVEVVGTDGDWHMVRLPEKIGYVYSGYMTLSDTGGEADGGLSLSIDPDKLSVETKNGNVFYLIIDRDDEGGETVHFLNQVDEADLMALTEDGEKAETPIVCTCTEKCQAGAVNTACPVCVKNLSECVGTEQKAAEPTEPENPEPEKKSNTGAILAVRLILAAASVAAVYFLVLKPKQGKKVPADLDDFDLEDEEEYLTEDEETEEKNE